MRNNVNEPHIRKMNTVSAQAVFILNLYLLSRQLVRRGDRVTNIADDVICLVAGKIVRGEMNGPHPLTEDYIAGRPGESP